MASSAPYTSGPQDDSAVLVDDASIQLSPAEKLERRDSLEKRLKLRPDAQDLKDRHVLLDTSVAP